MIRAGTIRTRLTLWYVFLLAVTVLGFSIYLHLELQVSLFTQVDAGLQVAASQLLVDVDDTVNPPTLRPMSATAVDGLMQSRSALRLITEDGAVVAEVGIFPDLTLAPLDMPGFDTLEVNGTPWRIYTQRVETESGQFDVWLQIAQSLNNVYDARNILLRLILFALPLALVVAALGGMFMANRALRPVDSITRTVKAISATDLSQRIRYQEPPDELGRLSLTLNSMLDRLQAAFESERRFTADASHELRTPLTAIKGHIGVTLTRQRSPEQYESALHHIQHETDRLIRLANDLLFLARLDASPLRWQPEKINLSDLLEAVVDQIEIIAREKNLTLTADISAEIPVQGIADHLIRLFLNILDNAVKYTPTGGCITVSVVVEKTDVCVIVKDMGAGIAPEHLAHLFGRFYRVGQDRSYSGGAGLGLAIAYEIAREHGGMIIVDSIVNQGATFTVRLPLSAP